ncbi:MAG: hypothetical protein JWO26_1561, partial [Rhodospirillales bacterium]|nr:hypothetical protein [Rhodospirillales bacterium]
PRGAFAVLALIFVLFHGADILPNLVLDLNAGATMLAGWGRGGERWDRIFQYSGHVTALLWTPNHALPAWLTVLLLLRHQRARGFLRVAALPLAAGAFWSLLGAAGAALLTLAAMSREGAWRYAAAAPANWMAAGSPCRCCLYLTAGTGAARSAGGSAPTAGGAWPRSCQPHAAGEAAGAPNPCRVAGRATERPMKVCGLGVIRRNRCRPTTSKGADH